ncbi:MAG: Na(+)-translocating NADH-quinone reductase subunit A [Microscillaceae bacterium]|nr:Na(+)-translocating NADH-quinone reductase subunit A [Microscillaceae bacterium]
MRIKLTKGFDIHLAGKANQTLVDSIHSQTYSFKPSDFKGIQRPKVTVNEGDQVKAGTPIFFDKKNPQVMFTAPVSGEVVAIHRGPKRFPEEIKILADPKIEYVDFPVHSEQSLASLSADKVREILLQSGAWLNFLERPFGIIPHPENTPKAIFISAYDSHPLAPDYEFVFKGEEKYLQAGIQAIAKLSPGKVHIGIKADANSLFKSLKGAEIHEFSGPHPSGNVGVQIHHIDPINKGEVVWTLTPYGLRQIGYLFLEGKYDASQIIAVVGSEVKNPQYYKTYQGVPVGGFLVNNLKNENVRIISGNVLTGHKINQEGTLAYYDHMFTVIPEGNYHEFLGWIAPSAKKLSFQRAFGLLSFLSPKKERALDSNMHGEERAYVQTGVFEQVLPMDILPMYLIKAILARDFEAMEALGIYEVLEEDFALCEFIDVSKTDIQKMLREGMNALLEA